MIQIYYQMDLFSSKEKWTENLHRTQIDEHFNTEFLSFSWLSDGVFCLFDALSCTDTVIASKRFDVWKTIVHELTKHWREMSFLSMLFLIYTVFIFRCYRVLSAAQTPNTQFTSLSIFLGTIEINIYAELLFITIHISSTQFLHLCRFGCSKCVCVCVGAFVSVRLLSLTLTVRPVCNKQCAGAFSFDVLPNRTNTRERNKRYPFIFKTINIASSLSHYGLINWRDNWIKRIQLLCGDLESNWKHLQLIITLMITLRLTFSSNVISDFFEHSFEINSLISMKLQMFS